MSLAQTPITTGAIEMHSEPLGGSEHESTIVTPSRMSSARGGAAPAAGASKITELNSSRAADYN
jgi:hypothetical protein